MHPVALTFGAACVGAHLLARRSRSGSAELVTLLLAIVWAAANHLAVNGGMYLLALADLPFALLAFALWAERRQRWQAWLCVLFGARLPLHLFAAWGSVEWVTYLHTINALFLASLIAAAWKGGIDELVAAVRVLVVRQFDRGVAAIARRVDAEAPR